jgi:acyl-CoA dehydrogenase
MAKSAAELLSDIERIAKDVTGPKAVEVDREGRFPGETFAALREAGVLGSAVQKELGGPGLDVVELGAQCTALGRRCAASGMVLSMHHIQVASIQQHTAGSKELAEYLKRVVAEQRLIASVTSEAGIGGQLRQSQAPVETTADGYALVKQATTISYGQHADDLLITARRGADAAPSDQVLVLAEKGSFELSDVGTWDSLGMRGTSSPGAKVSAHGPSWQVMSVPFADIATETMVPYSHILWAAVWLGIASDAAYRARRLVQKKARLTPGQLPSGAATLAQVGKNLDILRHEWQSLAERYRALSESGRRDELGSVAFAISINNLKLSASTLALDVVNGALNVTGIAGYMNNSEFSVGRHLRDIHSASLMIHNQRLEETNAALMLVHKGEA